LAITGSSTRREAAAHARDAVAHLRAAVSGSLVRRKRTVIWLLSVRDTEVMMSTPSMPAIESSSGLVTCDSMTSDEAPSSRVLTLTKARRCAGIRAG